MRAWFIRFNFLLRVKKKIIRVLNSDNYSIDSNSIGLANHLLITI